MLSQTSQAQGKSDGHTVPPPLFFTMMKPFLKLQELTGTHIYATGRVKLQNSIANLSAELRMVLYAFNPTSWGTQKEDDKVEASLG